MNPKTKSQTNLSFKKERVLRKKIKKELEERFRGKITMKKFSNNPKSKKLYPSYHYFIEAGKRAWEDYWKERDNP